MLGFYKHFKRGDVYEVLHLADDTNGGGPMVVYRNVKTREVYTRSLGDFIATMPNGVKRFELINALDSPLHLFVETLRRSRLDYLQMSRENPMFVSHGGNKTFTYVLGDKISFARAVRIINTQTANVLIGWLNRWQCGCVSGYEKYTFATDEYKKLVGVIKQAVFEGPEHAEEIQKAGSRECWRCSKPATFMIREREVPEEKLDTTFVCTEHLIKDMYTGDEKFLVRLKQRGYHGLEEHKNDKS